MVTPGHLELLTDGAPVNAQRGTDLAQRPALGVQRRRAVPNSGWVWGIIGGALAILFGILVLIRPGTGLITIIWIIGIWAIVWGITLIILGVQLRKAANTAEASTSPPA